MKVKINDAVMEVPDALTIAELLGYQKVKMPEMVSVQLNGAIVERKDFPSTPVREGDTVYFLYFMGRGAANLNAQQIERPSRRILFPEVGAMNGRTLAWCSLLLWTFLSASEAVRSETTIHVATNVATASVKRFGIGLSQINYYDTGQMLKELVFRNPGFEGLLFQSVVGIGSGTATNAVEDAPYTQWPTGFWDDGTYEFIWGTAKGRTGTITTSINPYDPGADTNGTTYVFADSGIAPALGDYMILHKSHPGDGGGGAAMSGWWTNAAGGGTISSELADLPPGTEGLQCVRLTATNGGQQAVLIANFDTFGAMNFVLLNGAYRLSFKAKGVGGNNTLQSTLQRGDAPYYVNQTNVLSGSWTNCSFDFIAAETTGTTGMVSLRFSPVNLSAVLLDDVSLRQTDSNPTNNTTFRDAVVATLRSFNPGLLRAPNWQPLGDSLDNQLAPSFARQRNGSRSSYTTQNDLYLGLHEFLELCETLGTEPWYPMPVTFSTQEIARLMEYLGGPTNTPYGTIRAARGHPLPWTNAFARIHIELGNESWNSNCRGGAILDPEAYGNRGSELFGVAKSSLYYDDAKFNFILGQQAAVPWRGSRTHNASSNHDTMAFGPYIGGVVDNFANDEELFGPLLAEPEMVDTAGGYMYQNYTGLLYSARSVPLAIYEVNLHTTGGSISQDMLNAFAPSLGAGLTVANHMLLMLRELHARDQCLFSVAGYQYTRSDDKTVLLWSVVRDIGVTDRKRPQYLACQLANEVLDGDMVTTTNTGDNPTWTVTNLNRVTYTNAHCVQSYALVSDTNRALLVFNFNLSNSLSVNFAGALAPAGNITWKMLTSSAVTNNNEDALTVFNTTQALTDYQPTQSLVLPPYSMSLFRWPALTALETWRLTNFQTVANSGDAADSADPDHDGLINHDEFLAGTNPNSTTSALRMTEISGDGSISFISVSSRLYDIEFRDDMITGQWNSLTGGVAGTGNDIWILDPEWTSIQRRFYRAVLSTNNP